MKQRRRGRTRVVSVRLNDDEAALLLLLSQERQITCSQVMKEAFATATAAQGGAR